MGILQVVWFGGKQLTHKNWLTEVTITRDVQARLASLLLSRHHVFVRKVLAGIFWCEQHQATTLGSLH